MHSQLTESMAQQHCVNFGSSISLVSQICFHPDSRAPETVCKDLQVGAISRKDKMKTICPVSNMNEKHMYISKHGHRSFYQIWYENTSCQLQYIVLFAGSQ
jgi:hypothetical protein